jgi:hypothetical protein
MTSNPRPRKSRLLTLGALVAGAAVLLVGVAPAKAADTAAAQCKGHWVRALGGSHSVTHKPVKDLADLQKRLAEFEPGWRDLIGRDASLEPGVADALIAAIQSGQGVVDRNVYRKEEVQWMAYRPAPKKLDVIAPPCIDLKKDYAALEIDVEIDDPMPTVASAPPNCAITATRQCEHENPMIALDLTGSDANPKVTVAAAGQSPSDVALAGTTGTVADPAPYSSDLTFTVEVTAPMPAERWGRVYRFLLPKTCGNLAYIGPGEKKQLPTTVPASCTKSATVAQCKPWCEVKVDPAAVVVHSPTQVSMVGGYDDSQAKLSVAGPKHATPLEVSQPPYAAAYTPAVPSCTDKPYEVNCEAKNAAGEVATASAPLAVSHHRWIFRPSLVYFMPTDGEQKRDITIAGDPAHEKFEVENGFGVAAALERRFGQVIGLEGAFMAGRANTRYTLSGALNGRDEHNANFYALTVGPNFHLLGCCTTDLYLGPFLGYGGLADPNYWVGDHHFHADLKGDFVWGAQLGLDVPFQATGDKGFHAGLRYLSMSQDTDAGSIDINPLTFEAGLFFRF